MGGVGGEGRGSGELEAKGLSGGEKKERMKRQKQDE